MKSRPLVVILIVLLLISAGFNIYFATSLIKPSNQAEEILIDNTEYENAEEIRIYVNTDMTTLTTGTILPEKFESVYVVKAAKYLGYSSISYNNESSQFGVDAFEEIKALLFKNQIINYQFKTDSNGKRVYGIEPYYVIISSSGSMQAIEAPSNINEIISEINAFLDTVR